MVVNETGSYDFLLSRKSCQRHLKQKLQTSEISTKAIKHLLQTPGTRA